MLVEFTKDTPIVDIGSDAHTVTGMIDVDGNLFGLLEILVVIIMWK